MRLTRHRVILIGFVALLVCGVAAMALIPRDRSGHLAPRAEGQKPVLMVLTTLPLLFPEEFTLEGGGSEALSAVETRYRVTPIGTTDAASLSDGTLLLMAHPLAQTADALVDLDRWVREGGRVLLLADPKLDWPSERPLGDKLRPPPSFADTGLLKHWGLTLAAPSESGPQQRELAGRQVLTASSGSLSGSCEVERGGFVARCALGKGRAVVVADADFLNVEDLDGPTESNLEALLAELDRLER
jgi:hypothetical protein